MSKEEHPYRPFPTEPTVEAPKYPRIICGDGKRRIVLVSVDTAHFDELQESVDSMGTKTTSWVTVKRFWSEKVEFKVARDHAACGMDYDGNSVSTSFAWWMMEQLAHLTGR